MNAVGIEAKPTHWTHRHRGVGGWPLGKYKGKSVNAGIMAGIQIQLANQATNRAPSLGWPLPRARAQNR